MNISKTLGLDRPGQRWLIVLTFLAVIATGFSGIILPTNYAPLVALGGMAAAFVGYACLKNPSLIVYIALFVGLLPVGVIPEAIHSILNRSLAVAAIGLWGLDAIINRRRIWITLTAIFMVSFLVWAVVTLFWVENFSAAATRLQVYVLRFLLFLFIIPNQIRTRKDLNGLLTTLSTSGWLLVVLTIIAILTQGYDPGSRFQLFNVNENSIGVMAMLAMAPVLIQASDPSKQSRSRTFMAGIFMLMTIALVGISGSRGSYISLLITLGAFWIWKSSRKWAVLGFAVMGLAALAAPFVFATTVDRFLELSDGSLLGEREVLWQAAWKLIGQHPLRGVGIGNASYAIVPHLTMLASTAGKESVSLHNPLLVIWSETGVLGIGLYLAVPVSAAISFIIEYLKCRKRKDKSLMPYFAFVSALFAGYMASWIKGGGMETDFLYFLLLALLLVPAALHRDTKPAQP